MKFCDCGTGLLVTAFTLSLLVTISAPYVSMFDVVRTHFGSGVSGGNVSGAISQIRYGIWGYCAKAVSNGKFNCNHTGLAYTVQLASTGDSQDISATWTRGLVMSPVATAFILLSLIFSWSDHLTMLLISSLLAFFSCMVTGIFLAINIAFWVYVRNQSRDLGVIQNTNYGPGFWMSLAVLVLTFFAAGVVCFGRRRHRDAAAADTYVANSNKTAGYGEKPTGWKRFVPGSRKALA